MNKIRPPHVVLPNIPSRPPAIKVDKLEIGELKIELNTQDLTQQRNAMLEQFGARLRAAADMHKEKSKAEASTEEAGMPHTNKAKL